VAQRSTPGHVCRMHWARDDARFHWRQSAPTRSSVRSPRADLPRFRECCAQPSAKCLARIDKGLPLADPYRVMCIGPS
jgi:hypothetical protein